MQEVTRIASFEVDHDYIVEGIYISRIDGDIITYDMRMRVPNADDYMSNIAMHSLEHMFATYARSGEFGKQVIYFGPMGCQTGFYLLMRDVSAEDTLRFVKDTLAKIINHSGDVFGRSRKECGNYVNLDLSAAQTEARRYLGVLLEREQTFTYPKGE